MTWPNFIGCLLLLGYGFWRGYLWKRETDGKVLTDVLKLLHESQEREGAAKHRAFILDSQVRVANKILVEQAERDVAELRKNEPFDWEAVGL